MSPCVLCEDSAGASAFVPDEDWIICGATDTWPDWSAALSVSCPVSKSVRKSQLFRSGMVSGGSKKVAASSSEENMIDKI